MVYTDIYGPMGTTHQACGLNIKDSGTRRDFGTGSVRDAATGKGRMDLLPVFALEKLYAEDCLRSLDTRANAYAYNVSWISPEARAKQTAFRLALKHVRGYTNEPFLVLAAYSAMVALELRITGGTVNGSPVRWVPLFALEAVSKLYEAGCAKYGDRNWEKGQPIHVYMDSGLRHLMKDLRGDTDEDHLVAACWNFLCAIETEERIEAGTLQATLGDGMPKMPGTVNTVSQGTWPHDMGKTVEGPTTLI